MLKKSILTVAGILGIVVLATLPGSAQQVLSPADQKLILQQARDLDPQANDVDEKTGQPRFKPLPSPKHHGHDRTGTPTASDIPVASLSADAMAIDDPMQIGSWTVATPFTTDQNMVHVVCSPTGKCLYVVGKANKLKSYVYSPATGALKLVATPIDLFCAGHVLLPDGRALVTGGTAGTNPWKGAKTQFAFDFVSESYQRLPDMAVGRWYPSVVTMHDGRQLITSGFSETGPKTSVVEVFDPRTNVTSKLTPQRSLPNYPRTYQTSKPQEIFHAGPSGAGFWNPFTGAFKSVAKPADARGTGYGSCFFGDVRDQNLMIMGGGWPATATTHVIDLDSAAAAYKPGPAMTAAKGYVSCVNLPDGTLFEANGGADNTRAAASRNTGILSSLSGQWQGMAPLPGTEHRLYHSLLYLLDDGRVVSVASNPEGGLSAQSKSNLIYSPPYLSKGERPVITDFTQEVAYGGTYAVATTAAAGSTVTRITVTSAPSATHSVDLNQRYLSLPLTDGLITFPTQNTVMPPGWYRIWAVDNNNVPSVARWIHIQ